MLGRKCLCLCKRFARNNRHASNAATDNVVVGKFVNAIGCAAFQTSSDLCFAIGVTRTRCRHFVIEDFAIGKDKFGRDTAGC